MASIFDYLKCVEQYPGLALACPDEERGRQLENLQLLIHGYSVALQRHGLSEPAGNFLNDFGRFLRQRFGWSMCSGPITAIRRESESDDVAWHRFWTLVWEFRESLETAG